MHEINIVDCTFRDAHQSLWGERMNTAMMYKIAPLMNRAGFRAMEVTSISHIQFAVRYLREDPWERLRLLSRVIQSTPMSIMMGGTTLSAFKIVRGPITSNWMQRLAANGLRRVQMMEATVDMHDMGYSVEAARDAGLQAVIAMAYSHSPVHTDEFYAQRTRDAVKLRPDAIYLKDAGGLLTPDRTRTLIPSILQNTDGIPLEIHSHCTTGLAPLCYLEAMRLGVRIFHTAVSPLANGSSLPSTESILRFARHLGLSSNVDEEAVRGIAEHFREVAKREGLPIGVPLEYDLYHYDHQVPGGVISNLKRQLSEMGLESRLEEVLEETVRVRKELGYPIMITPFSQFVVTQATINVTQGERYKIITDEVIHLALGHWGKMIEPLDQNLMDRISGLSRTKELLKWKPEEISIEDLRGKFGCQFSEDDLLLLLHCSEEDVRAMRAAGPVKTNYCTGNSTVDLIKELTRRKNTTYISIRKENLSLSLKRIRH